MGKKALKLDAVGKRCAKILQDHAATHGMTNAQIALEVDLSEATISRVFNHLRPMTIDELDAIADAVGLIGWGVLREAEEGMSADVIAFPRAAKTDPRWEEETDQ